jgi:agmatinase
LDREKNSHRDLYVSPTHSFLGVNYSEEEAEYLLLGVPYDGTSTFRPGSRFGPDAIREASRNLETISLRGGMDLEDVRVCDLGDLDTASSLEETLRRLELVTKANRQQRKLQVSLGGEHSITLGTVRAWGDKVGVLDFDAHMDMRDEYLGTKFSHATFMRRLFEEIGGDKIVQVGIRAVCKEELRFAKEKGISFFSSYDLIRSGVASIADQIRGEMSDFEKIYITVDADVLDPSFAPAVGNPEPEGISTAQLIELLYQLVDHRVVGIDLVEVSPIYDQGTTAIQVCKVLFEAICSVENSRDRA